MENIYYTKQKRRIKNEIYVIRNIYQTVDKVLGISPRIFL